MGCEGCMPPPHIRRPLPDPGITHPDPYGPGMQPPPPPPHNPFPHFDLPPPEVMEQKLAGQHMEMQMLFTKNQRLATTHGTLSEAGTCCSAERVADHTISNKRCKGLERTGKKTVRKK